MHKSLPAAEKSLNNCEIAIWQLSSKLVSIATQIRSSNNYGEVSIPIHHLAIYSAHKGLKPRQVGRSH